MRYVPTGPAAPTSPPAATASAMRSAVRELRAEAARCAWAAREPLQTFLHRPAGAPAADGTPDRLGGLLTELRAATTQYVCAVRSEGARPEQMLVGVKAFVREAMVAEGWPDRDAVQAITAEVVGWSIAAYYDR